MKKALVSTFLLLGLFACDSTIVVSSGEWGGEHISLIVIPKGGIVELDCAQGTITEKIQPNAKGVFSSKGLFSPEHGGPILVGEVLPEYPALYEGETDGETMTLHIRRTDNGQKIGTFSLGIGSKGRLFKCLMPSQ